MTENAEFQPFSLRDEETICFIPDDLRHIVVRILQNPGSARAVAATRDLHERAEHDDPYLIASSVYDFLWKRVPMEQRRLLYPTVGDFFLTALEKQLARIGPNNMSSRFRELLECYSGAGDQQRMLEGPLYCVDLFLLKTTQLVLNARNSNPNIPSDDENVPEFLDEEKLTLEEQVTHSLQLAKDALLDMQRTLSRLMRTGHDLNDRYVAFIRATMDRLTLSWQHWQEMHAERQTLSDSPERYFKKGIARAEKVNSLVLAALLLEQVGEEYQNKMCKEFLNHRFTNRPPDHPMRGSTFDAAEIYRDQGVIERNHGAFILAERRFTRAIHLFEVLHDRTSIAQTLIERARLYSKKNSDLWKAQYDLHHAVQNIAAVQRRVPANGALPNLSRPEVLQFYEEKGLTLEADLYRSDDPTLSASKAH